MKIKAEEAKSQDQKTNIDVMSSDFAKILKSCLEKMSERIDFGNQSYAQKQEAAEEMV